MHLLITAGPTREYLDDVRFLSNASSGKMGYALAAAAAQRGHIVELVSGPTELPPPVGCRFHPVLTTGEMSARCAELFPACDGVIGAAAVCDYRPREKFSGKLKKTGGPITLELVETEDILAGLGRNKGQRFVVGFALEAQQPRENALRKLQAKSCDAIVLNHPRAIGSDDNDIELINAVGQTAKHWIGPKAWLAEQLIDWIEQHLVRSSSRS